jgi:diaminopimelate decarboxylase
LHHHLAATGNFGQVIQRNYPIALLQKLEMPDVERVNIVGPLCTPLDILGAGVDLPEAAEGDLIGIFASGAYGFSASPRGFLSHPEPMEIVAGM